MDRKTREEVAQMISDALDIHRYENKKKEMFDRLCKGGFNPGEVIGINSITDIEKALHKGIEIGLDLASEKPKNHLKHWHPSEEAFLENRFDKFVDEMAKHFNRTKNSISYKIAKTIKDSGIKVYEVEKDWITESGLRAVCIMANDGDHRCGYVGIPKDHVLYGVDHSEHSDKLSEAYKKVMNEPIGKRSIFTIICHRKGHCSPEIIFDVHGSITYSGGRGKYPVKGDEWWFGFDCAHAGDKTKLSFSSDDVERTLDYVVSECESLAKQLSEITKETK